MLQASDLLRASCPASRAHARCARSLSCLVCWPQPTATGQSICATVSDYHISRNTFGDGCLRPRWRRRRRWHPPLLGRGNHTWIPVAFVGLARAVGGTARAARPPPPSACINQVNSRRLALGPAVPQTKSGTRCGVRPAGSCLLLRPRPCTARPWYYRTVGERVARSRAACVPRLRHTL